jgi:hypothetical protein
LFAVVSFLLSVHSRRCNYNHVTITTTWRPSMSVVLLYTYTNKNELQQQFD